MNKFKSVQIDVDKYKIELPLLEKGEIDVIDNYFNEISDDFSQKYVHDRDLAAAQMVIRHLREENKQLNKVINKARLYIDEHSEFTHREAYRNIHNGRVEYTDAGKVFFGNVTTLQNILKEVK